MLKTAVAAAASVSTSLRPVCRVYEQGGGYVNVTRVRKSLPPLITMKQTLHQQTNKQTNKQNKPLRQNTDNEEEEEEEEEGKKRQTN